MAECAVDDCHVRRYARGWCQKHYERWRRTGTTDSTYPPVPPAVLAWVEHILVTRNVDGKVPLDIACDLLDDMAHIAGSRTAPRHSNHSHKEAS